MKKKLVYVIEQSLTIRGAINLFLRKDYDVFTFGDSQSFNEYLKKQNEVVPYILLVETSSAKEVPIKNNVVIIVASKSEMLSNSEGLVLNKPFAKEELRQLVEKAELQLRTVTIVSHKENLEKELPINDVDDKKRIKV